MDDYEIEEGPCPHCGNAELHVMPCDVLYCEDGWIDEHEEDPINFAPGDSEYECRECHGTGWHRWCPACGKDVILGRESKMLAKLAEQLQLALDELMDDDLPNLIDECDHVGHGNSVHEIMLAPVVAVMAAGLLEARDANREPDEV